MNSLLWTFLWTFLLWILFRGSSCGHSLLWTLLLDSLLWTPPVDPFLWTPSPVDRFLMELSRGDSPVDASPVHIVLWTSQWSLVWTFLQTLLWTLPLVDHPSCRHPLL